VINSANNCPSVSNEAQSDSDQDGVQDGADRCVYEPDASNLDSGELLGVAPSVDGVGDVCQCGDTDGSGAVFGAPTENDVERVWSFVLGTDLDPDVAALGSVVGGPEVDVRDIVVLERAVSGLGPQIAGVCANALPD